MKLFISVRDYLDTLVHPSVRQDALTSARHRAFIASRLIGSLLALAGLPAYLALRGTPSLLEALVFCWLLVPILIAYFLSRTARYEAAHVLSSLALTSLVTAVAAVTGGIGSFSTVWLVVVPLEAALAASRRAVAFASTLALTAAAGLLLAEGLDWLPPHPSSEHAQAALAALGIISAALYATGLALGAESLARRSLRLLDAEEDRYRLLAHNMTDVITRHGRAGAVLFVSPAAELLFGVKVSDLCGHGLFDRVHVADRPAYLTALADSATQGESRSVEFRVRREPAEPAAHPASHFVWVEMRCRPLDEDAEAEPSEHREVVAVMRDISARKAQELELKNARSAAERANAAKSQFLATMSHELRTPLNAIIGFSEMLSNEASLMIDAERRHEYATLIRDSGRHLLSVVNGILDKSKIEAGHYEITPEPIAAQEVIADCCDLLTFRARESGVELVTRLPADLPEIVADKRSLHQILLNLLSNGIKFNKRGGKVVVSASVEEGGIILSVEDTGVGIDTEDLPRIGDPFFQARSSYDRRHDGTGLGLSIVKGLLALHGGEMRIESRLGEGTKISVHLPFEHDSMPKEFGRPHVMPVGLRSGEQTAELRVRKSA